MWLIVGLGNPGSRYSRTRHNVGFWVVEDLTYKSHREFREKSDYRICDGSIEDQKVILLEPLTYMNRSGTALRKVMDKFTILPENLIVIHDDLDLEAGKVRIRKKGSSGGHRGVESIIQNIGTNSFIRIKIGIGRSPFISAEDYVLSKFRREEIPLIRKAVDRAVDSIHAVISEGVEKAMNRFNVF